MANTGLCMKCNLMNIWYDEITLAKFLSVLSIFMNPVMNFVINY